VDIDEFATACLIGLVLYGYGRKIKPAQLREVVRQTSSPPSKGVYEGAKRRSRVRARVGRKNLEAAAFTPGDFLPNPADSDRDIIKFFRICFDRPALKTPFFQEVSQEDFIKAIEDTITAINTGTLIHREDRTVLRTGSSRQDLSNPEWRAGFAAIEGMLQQIRQFSLSS
jgi:hypothetical protein